MNRIAVIVASVWVVVAASLAGVGAVGATPTDTVDGETESVTDAGVVLAQTGNATDDGSNETDTENATSESDEDTENETLNVSVGPGAQLAGVIGVQQAEFQGEIQHRAFGLSIAAARSNGSKAQIVASSTEHLHERIQQLENQTAALNESYQNGSISTGTYHARLAHLSVQIRMTERLVNQTAESAAELPPETQRAHGVNVTLLHNLRGEASNMTGHEVAAIARQIGGKQVGHPLGKERGPPADRPGQGPPDEREDGDQPDQMGPPGAENGTSPMNNSTMGPGNGGGPGDGNPGNPGGQGNGNQNATDGPGSNAVGELLTILRSLFTAPW